ncbi:J domain-containing protein required for chloroplast accumulation response 1 [Juglans microcarpa x Juglans regia]|uniref:J domain-containing protein required for chloroplast accumulation response 1 n=1 Tax=Juglans microcarpa x Juglans regia TaxID=2249226 RepID=UPI001B7EF729|nr:J domain-containing protein required for chloroplast accumulation response 1 [Juglans microcarpa x Juglans regia]
MDRFSYRESVLLGYTSRRGSFTNSSSSPKTPSGDSDFDFHDVFGGPPRRLSMQEKRPSFNEATGFYGRKSDDEGALPCRIGELAVFGGENANRRRDLSNDFFDDIFRGDESSNSTPRNLNKDPFSSSPGSRILSPARLLPPKADPFGIGSSIAPQLSLPAKLTRGTDLLVFGSTHHSPSKYKNGPSSSSIGFSYSSTSNLSRLSSQAIQSQEELGNDVQSSYQQSPLSQEISRSRERLPDLIKSNKRDTEGNIETESEVPKDGSQFHFSIYKWAHQGVPLAMPFKGGSRSKLKESAKIERCSSSNGWLGSRRRARETPENSLRMECNKLENYSVPDASTQDRVKPCQNVEEAILHTPESESLSGVQKIVEEVPGNTISHDVIREVKPQSLPTIDLHDNAEKENTVLTKKVHKPAGKPLRSLLSEEDHEQDKDGISEKGEGKESTVESTKTPFSVVDVSENAKKQDGKETTQNDVEADKLGRNRAKGRVKEFVKIFNQGASQKPKDNSPKLWKKDNYIVVDEFNISTTGVEEKTPRASVIIRVPETFATADEYLKQSEKEHSAIKTSNYILSDTLSGQKDYSSSTASTLNGSKAIVEDTDESSEGNFLIKEVPQGENELLQSGDEDKEIQAIDAKIRQWCNGKTGNIRSLLSTLQYVLWPESGWKTVPLVDIIEGTSVKRAYQKALLCLHPDKLQQKGAASHQKYIAEKVFEILQEAWTHFNSLGSL